METQLPLTERPGSIGRRWSDAREMAEAAGIQVVDERADVGFAMN